MRPPLIWVLAFGLITAVTTTPTLAASKTERVSVGPRRIQGNGPSSFFGPAISADGRFVAFDSTASNLVPHDTNDAADVFVHDRKTRKTERVSLGAGGVQGNGDSSGGTGLAISADGRFVAFYSNASNLVPNDTNADLDIFVRDRKAGTTTRVNVGPGGVEVNLNGSVHMLGLSAEGRFATFTTAAAGLVPDDTNNAQDVFLRDLRAGTTERVSVGPNGIQADGASGLFGVPISADGRFVAFGSYATNLVPGDTNGASCPGGSCGTDVFVRDREAGTTERVSLGPGGIEANNGSDNPAMSADGRFVVFQSEATNLVRRDTNGVLDVFVHDRKKGTTERVSIGSRGVQANQMSGAYSNGASISTNGRFVAFQSDATNLVPHDTNRATDVFVRDRHADRTQRISVGPHSVQGNRDSGPLAISADGRFVAFDSSASNLVPRDTNRTDDVFVHGR
jgi:Tol biopolymer transport system component